MAKISTVDNLPVSNILFKMNGQCVETDNVALYRRSGDNFIRNEYYKITQPLPYLPDLIDPFDHLLLYREGNRSPYRAAPLATLSIHDPLVSTHNVTLNSLYGTTLSLKTVESFAEPFDLTALLILWSNSEKNANVNFTEFPAIRTVSFFHVFSQLNPTDTLRVFTYDAESGLRTLIPLKLIARQSFLGLSGELFSFQVILPVEVRNLFLEYTDLVFLQGYQQTPYVFKDTIYLEDYPDRLLPNDISLRTKRTINVECARDIPIYGTPASGLVSSLIPLFDESYNPTGFALIEKYVKNGILCDFSRTISTPDKIRFIYYLPQRVDAAALEFIMTAPTNLPPDIVLPDFSNFIFPRTILIESRLQETDSWQTLDEISLDLLDWLRFLYQPDLTRLSPRFFTKFCYLTYRCPIRELRFTIQSLTNYTPLLHDGNFDISRSHLYFPQVKVYNHAPH